jgi:hypothetical protein
MDMVNTKTDKKQKKGGRPRGRSQDRPLNIRVNEAFYVQLDEWRARQPGHPSRSEAIRLLVEFGIAAKAGGG